METRQERTDERRTFFDYLKRIMRIVLLLGLLFGAFLLYSITKVREMQTVLLPASPQVEEMNLYRHVEHLSVKIGSRSVFEYEKLNAAKAYILSSLDDMGYLPMLQHFSYRDRMFSNIIVSLEGGSRPEDIVLIGAHYDTVLGTPGADDNASAVAVLLEMCRLLKDYRPGLTLRMVFFALEEPPVFRTDFMGSAVHAEDAAKKNENIKGMISLEMLGYYSTREGGQSFPLPFMSLMYSSTPDFIGVVGNLSSRGLVDKVAASLKKTKGLPVETLATFGFVPGVDFSDQISFWKKGYQAVMITDTAFYRNPNYHSEQDTIDTLDFNRMSLLLDALVETAKDMTR